MTDRDALRDRLDAVADAVGPTGTPAETDAVTPREREAIRAALRHRYTTGPDLVGDPFGSTLDRSPPSTATALVDVVELTNARHRPRVHHC